MKDNNILGTDDEQFLDKLTSYFENEREYAAIRDAVAMKVSASNLTDVKKTPLFWFPGVLKIIFISASTLAIVALIYFLFLNNNFDNKIQNSIAVTENKPVTVKTEKEVPAQKAELKKIDNDNKSKKILNNKRALLEQNNLHAQKAVKGFTSSHGSINSENTKSSTLDITYEKTINLNINVPPSYKLESLNKNIIKLLADTGFKVKRNNSRTSSSNDKILSISTRGKEGVSQDGETVKYYLDFKISNDNPEVLKIKMVASITDKQNDPGKKGHIVEEFFNTEIKQKITSMLMND